MKQLRKIKLSTLLSSDKARIVFVVIGLCAILLIFISGQFENKKDTKEITKEMSSSDYCENLKEELTEMIENLEGVGDAQVLLTLESSYEYIYLDDDKTLTKILEPKIRGVVVICAGGNDPVVKERITKLLSTILSVSTSSISVSKSI